jgi:hypothetical protein
MIVLDDKITTEKRLAELGLSINCIVDALTMASNARAATSPLSPNTAAGTNFFNTLVASLRNQLIAQGWSFSNADNFSLVISPTKDFQLACARGSKGTGLPNGKIPKTRSIKGPKTISAIYENQLGGWNVFPGIFPPPEQCTHQGRLTWWLLYNYRDNDILSELSFPVSYSSVDHRPDGWQERIMLPTITLDVRPYSGGADEQMVIDIPIKLK